MAAGERGGVVAGGLPPRGPRVRGWRVHLGRSQEAEWPPVIFEPMASSLHRLLQHPVPSKTRMAELARLAKTGDPAAREELILGNIRFVVWAARRFQGLGVSLEDLIGWGVLGLLRAVDEYDPDRGMSFPTYSVWWIRHFLHDGLRAARFVRLPAKAHLDRLQSRSLVPVLDETVSLDVEVFQGSARTRADELVATGAGPMSGLERDDRRKALRAALDGLDPKERKVLRMRFGFDGDPMTLKAVGQVLGLSRERIRQIESKALGQLRSRRTAKALRGVA